MASNRTEISSSKSKAKYGLQRLLTGILAILFAVVAILVRISNITDEGTAGWIFGVSGKFAFLMAMVWLAWPQVVWLIERPGGAAALGVLSLGALVFLTRPKAMVYILPVLLAGAVVLIAIAYVQTFVRNNK